MATKNLGNVRALISSPTPPTNKSLIWEDTSSSPYSKKVWNNSTLVWDPLNPTGGNSEITIDNAAVYSDSLIYGIVGTVVTFSNPSSLDPQFQIPQLYQLTIALSVSGINPEESPYDSELGTGNWQFIGQSFQEINDNTSKIHITGSNTISQLKSITGYKNGDNVVFVDYNTILTFNQNAVIGSYNPSTNTYPEVWKPYDWTDPLKGGWVEQSSTSRQRKFYASAAAIRDQARNYPIEGDVVDLSTGNILRLTTAGAPFTDNGTTIIIPTYRLFDVPCAFVKVGELGSGGGHTIKDSDETFTQRAGLKFIGNVAVTDDSGGDNTVVEILGQNITVDAVPTDGSNNPVASNGVFDALADKVTKNSTITGATKTKITYDSKGLVTGGSDATTADISDSTNKRYVTEAEKTVLGNTSGVNSGNQTATTLPVTPPIGYTSTDMQGLSNEFALRIWREDLTAWVGNETSLTLISNVFRDFGTVGVSTAVTVTLTAVTSPQLAHYAFKFKYGTGGSFTFTGIHLASGNPTLTNGKYYEASIVRGELIYKEVQ